MSAPVIEVEHISKVYRLGSIGVTTLREGFSNWWDGVRGRAPAVDHKEFWAVRDISFSVQPGEVVGVIGRNGAGKSTLLKILSRITEPTSGRARIRGRVASLLEVGTGFHPDLTGRQNVFLNGAILGMTQAEVRRKFDEIVAFSEVGQFIDTPVKRYSSGMYVRLAFAVAAHLEPEILIVDEVLAVGDAQFQDKCMGKMESVARSEGRTVLFVSHNIGAIARFCRRGLLLNQGRVVVDGPIDAAIDGYLQMSGVAQDGMIELPAKNRIENSALTLRRMLINDGEPLGHRRPLKIKLNFTIHRPTKAGFDLGFGSVDGRRIVTLESDYEPTYFDFTAPGNYAVELSLPIFDLLPGRYRVDICAFDGVRKELHFVFDSASVDVMPSSATPPHIHGTVGDWRPVSNWRLCSA